MLAGAGPILLAGAGKMGGAMLERWIASGLDPRSVGVLDPHLEPQRRAALESAGVAVAADTEALAGRAWKVLVLAVKPQIMPEALARLEPLVGADTVVVSIAAGVRIAALQAAFGPGQPVIRAMPNTPAQIGQGATVAVAGPQVSDAQKAIVDALLAAVGKVAWIGDESLIDAVTAVSGSGPAYVFLLAECLAEAGRQAGLPGDLADLLGRQTVVGSGALLAESALSPAALRENVTSPQGTTAAALAVLMGEGGLQPLLSRAVDAARRRAIELG